MKKKRKIKFIRIEFIDNGFIVERDRAGEYGGTDHDQKVSMATVTEVIRLLVDSDIENQMIDQERPEKKVRSISEEACGL